MEYKVYDLTVLSLETTTDLDMCPTTTWEPDYENTYASKKEAIRQAQRRFAKRHLNDYVLAVHASVTAITISDKGVTYVKRIYNLYKNNK